MSVSITVVINSHTHKKKQAAEKQIQKVLQEIQAGIVPTRPTIFHTIISPPPDADTDPDYNPPPISQIVDEAYGLTGAASDTTGNVMCMAAFHVLQDENRDIRRELQAELAEAFPHDMKDSGLPYQKLEKLPYLTAVIKEGLRLSYGVIHPIPRVVVVAAASSSEKRERGGVVFNGVFVPSGVSFFFLILFISISSPLLFPFLSYFLLTFLSLFFPYFLFFSYIPPFSFLFISLSFYLFSPFSHSSLLLLPSFSAPFLSPFPLFSLSVLFFSSPSSFFFLSPSLIFSLSLTLYLPF